MRAMGVEFQCYFIKSFFTPSYSSYLLTDIMMSLVNLPLELACQAKVVLGKVGKGEHYKWKKS